MPNPDHGATLGQPPDWALERASAELYDEPDDETTARRAREIAEEAQEREDEQHDEYDDPDQGGEG